MFKDLTIQNTGKYIFYFLLCTSVIIVYTTWKDIYLYTAHLYLPRYVNETSDIWHNTSIWPPKDHCPSPEQTGRWRMVSKGCFVFSAYIDSRTQPKVVRVIGAHDRRFKGPDKCHLYFTGDFTAELVTLQVKNNTGYHWFRLSPYVYTCPIPTHRTKDPCAVKLSKQSRSQMGLLPIYRSKSTTKKNFTVCVPTLYGYRDTHQLVQTIEANRIFGADNFIIYKSWSSKEVEQYLSYYVKNNVVTVIPWSIPRGVGRGLHYHGQLVTIQDCYYRSRNDSNFVVFTDMDEVIVPRNASSWTEMIRAAAKGNQTEGGYIFRSKSFCINEAVEGLSIEVQKQARQLGADIVVRRAWDIILKKRQRSKVIVSSESAIHVGIHSVHGYMPGHGDILVDIDVGLIHHYRLKHLPMINCTFGTTLDTYMDRFATKLLANVKKVYEHINPQLQYV